LNGVNCGIQVTAYASVAPLPPDEFCGAHTSGSQSGCGGYVEAPLTDEDGFTIEDVQTCCCQ
jgi:hypothetical protein